MPRESPSSHSSAITGGKAPPHPLPAKTRPTEVADLVEPVILSEDEDSPASKPPIVPGTVTAQKPPRLTAIPMPAMGEGELPRATAATWQQLVVVYTISTALHALVLLAMGWIVLPQELREEIFSVFARQEVEIPNPPPAMDYIMQDPEIIEERARENAMQDVTALVVSDTDADNSFHLNISDEDFRLKPDTANGPSLPVELGSMSAGRSEAARAKMLAERGGNAASDASVVSALEWLASVQRKDGSWDFNDVGEAGEEGELSSPTGATGLVLMAFLGAGHTHAKECKYQEPVQRGIDYLLKAGIERPAGLDFRGKSPGTEGMYVQAIVTTALAEALGMTEDPELQPVVQKAVNFVVRAQHSEGGWRYEPNTSGDTSVVGWQVMALKSASHSNIAFPKTVFSKMRRFLADVSHADGSQYSYMPGQGPRPSTTAIGLLCRMYTGWKIETKALETGVKYLARVGPLRNDIYYDYYASQVMIQFTGAKGDAWTEWNTALRDWLVATQKKTGPAEGSWDVIESGHKGERGGRLYTTCLAVMTLEIYYRVLPLYQRATVEGEF